MFLSTNHGGISRAWVLLLMARAHGRTSSYVISDMGAPPPGRWQFSHECCRIGATSFANVTCCDSACAPAGAAAATIPASASPAATVILILQCPLRHSITGPRRRCPLQAGR